MRLPEAAVQALEEHLARQIEQMERLGDLYEDQRLGSNIQTLTTSELVFRALLTKGGAQRLELATT